MGGLDNGSDYSKTTRTKTLRGTESKLESDKRILQHRTKPDRENLTANLSRPVRIAFHLSPDQLVRNTLTHHSNNIQTVQQNAL